MIGWSIPTNRVRALADAIWRDLQRHGLAHPSEYVLTSAATVANDDRMVLELRICPLTGMHTLEAWRVGAPRYRAMLQRDGWLRNVYHGVQAGYLTHGVAPSVPTRDAGRRSVVWRYALREFGGGRA